MWMAANANTRVTAENHTLLTESHSLCDVAVFVCSQDIRFLVSLRVMIRDSLHFLTSALVTLLDLISCLKGIAFKFKCKWIRLRGVSE